MNLNTQFALLTHLPLLQGLGSRELAQLEPVLEMEELPALPRPIIQQGEYCGRLIFLVEGLLKKGYKSPDGRFCTWQTLEAPCVIEPESLYSLRGTYQHSYQTLTNCRFINLRRGDVTERLMKLDIFRINYVNMLVRHIERRDERLQPTASHDVRHKFHHFVQQLFPDTVGAVTIEIRMLELADFLGETRLTVSRLLNKLQAEGRLTLGRGRIHIREIKDIIKL